METKNLVWRQYGDDYWADTKIGDVEVEVQKYWDPALNRWFVDVVLKGNQTVVAQVQDVDETLAVQCAIARAAEELI